ncbi:hypothetical protein QBC35DRAFT_137229 [Podospora australis]|uniref:Uncharacterized protein n=1 Tax=Podospora australis TaxID=1536484 RepID=A0AAN6WW96_9PEZI|nr:hypothetical protein QBC35DRAFT_137229 [Podospora australis]
MNCAGCTQPVTLLRHVFLAWHGILYSTKPPAHISERFVFQKLIYDIRQREPDSTQQDGFLPHSSSRLAAKLFLFCRPKKNKKIVVSHHSRWGHSTSESGTLQLQQPVLAVSTLLARVTERPLYVRTHTSMYMQEADLVYAHSAKQPSPSRTRWLAIAVACRGKGSWSGTSHSPKEIRVDHPFLCHVRHAMVERFAVVHPVCFAA